MKDLETLPKDAEIPPRPKISRGTKKLSNKAPVGKANFLYMKSRHFRGRFTIPNWKHATIPTSRRLAAVLSSRDRLLVLSITNRKEGNEWRLVKLKSAFKTNDEKFCVIDIEPPTVGKEVEP